MSVQILRGDARDLPLPDESVDLIVTSPPYFALRSYTDGGEHYGAQIGSETTPQQYAAALLDCTREWMRVLKPTGSLFVNLGDKYSERASPGWCGSNDGVTSRHEKGARRNTTEAAPRKSLLGLPWRYALGCIDDLGLILRAEIIWAKPNGLPESVTDRVRRSHEQIFHFTRQPRYYSAVDDVREPHAEVSLKRAAPHRADPGRAMREGRTASGTGMPSQTFAVGQMAHPLGKLPGSVWEITSQPLSVPAHLNVDHFAAFPMDLPRRCILGWSPSGICTACGEPRRPVAGQVALDMARPQARKAHQLAERAGLTEDHLNALLSVGISDTGRGAATQDGTGKNSAEVYALADEARAALGGYAREYLLRRPTAISYACGCPDTSAATRPAVVLDPFGGTGTTALVADVLGRNGISVDRSADYCRLARWRTSDPGERARALGVPKPPPVIEGQLDMFGGVAS